MSFRQNPEVSCDWPGCFTYSRDETMQWLGDKASEIRARLKDQFGWNRQLGLDFCGHHPALADHRPKLTASNSVFSSGVRASCSCGWRDEEGAWAPLRPGAILRWRMHLPKEDSSACSELLYQAKKARGDAV